MGPEDSILMSVGGLTLDPATKTPIVILRDGDNTMNLPIWIGLLEATAIATELEGIQMARPSDAISLALRLKSPIYVARKVLEASSVLQQNEASTDSNLSNVSPEKWSEILEKMSPDDFKYKM